MDNYKRGMRAATRAKREADLVTLATYLETKGAYEGITEIDGAPASLWIVGRGLGWPEHHVRTVMDFATDNPELGISIHVKRGRTRMIVLTYNGASTGATPFVTDMLKGEVRENFKRQIRTWCKALVRLKQADATRVETRNLQWEIALQENLMRNVKFALITRDEEQYADEIAKIEAALSL